LYEDIVGIRVAESEVKYSTQSPTFPKIFENRLRLSKLSDSDYSTQREWNLAVKSSGNRGAQQEISTSTKVSK